MVWRSFSGDNANRGCHGGLDLPLDAPSGVLAFPAASLDACKHHCEAMDPRDCKGIEYLDGTGNSCLLWSQPVKGTVERAGASCLVRVPPGDFALQADSACRRPGVAVPHAVHSEFGMKLEACQTLCLTTLSVECRAVEYAHHEGHCLIFNRSGGEGGVAIGVVCSRFMRNMLTPASSRSVDIVPRTTLTTTLARGASSTRLPAVVSTSRSSARERTEPSSTRTEPPTTTATTGSTASLPTAAAEVCKPPVEGGSCHSNVLSTMKVAKQIPPGQTPKGLLGKGGACAGLGGSSSFEDFQACLHTEPDFGCGAPCPCHTAVPGERCYQTVMWVMNEGIEKNPEWFPGLGPRSSFEDIQAFLHEDENSNASCVDMPCVQLPRWPGAASLFCFSVVKQTGYEPEVMETQLQKGLGIFACDGHAVLCSDPLLLRGGDGGQSRTVHAIQFEPAPVGISKDGTAANTQLFMNVWDVVRTSTPFSRYEWTVKVDPDAVLLPDRLALRLLLHSGHHIYVRNCNKVPDSDDFPMMFGAVEMISCSALQAYFGGVDRCQSKLTWQDWGEDFFMGKCLNSLGVGTLDDFEVISDGVCSGVDCSDERAAAFHPFKSKDGWLECWSEARSIGPALTV